MKLKKFNLDIGQRSKQQKTGLFIIMMVLIALAIMVRLHWLGSGDVIFITALLFTFGLENTAIIILCACLITLPFFYFHRQAHLPFLPALCLATIIVLTLTCS